MQIHEAQVIAEDLVAMLTDVQLLMHLNDIIVEETPHVSTEG